MFAALEKLMEESNAAQVNLLVAWVTRLGGLGILGNDLREEWVGYGVTSPAELTSALHGQSLHRCLSPKNQTLLVAAGPKLAEERLTET